MIPHARRRDFSFDFVINGFGIFPEIAEENVTPGIFSLTIVAVAINGNPVMAISVLVGSVAVPHVVPVVNMLVESLRDPHRHRKHEAEQSVENPRCEVWIMNEVV